MLSCYIVLCTQVYLQEMVVVSVINYLTLFKGGDSNFEVECSSFKS